MIGWSVHDTAGCGYRISADRDDVWRAYKEFILRARRVDGNQREIVAALRRAGATVRDVSHMSGLGFDLIVKSGGTVRVVEVKNPEAKPSDRKLTRSEQEAHALWADQYRVIETVDEALAMLEDM